MNKWLYFFHMILKILCSLGLSDFNDDDDTEMSTDIDSMVDVVYENGTDDKAV